MKCALMMAAVATAALVVTGFGFEAKSRDDAEKERQAVERACLDYVEGVYEVKPELIKRSVHPKLTKYGYWRGGNAAEYRGMSMTYEQLHDLASKFNADGHIPQDAPKEVVVFDVMDKTASAKLTAHWGIDYFHLIKEDDQWQILQVVWQSPPR